MESEQTVTIEKQAKAAIYGFLAGIFCTAPSADSAGALRELATDLGIACPREIPLDELRQEYLELLVIPNPRYVAPYESVFRDQWPLPPVLKRGSNPAETGATIKGLLMGESTLAVRDCYLKQGLLPEEDLPDHISNELRFLAYVCAREAEAPPEEARKWAELAGRFRRDHVLQWIADLRARVAERERCGYYGSALRVVEAVLREEAD
jgi:TorA maturation chaperone TorD